MESEPPAGSVVRFRWLDGTLTGVVVNHPKPGKWRRIRTKGSGFTVPPEDIVEVLKRRDGS